MERRLYFTFPRAAQARRAVEELVAGSIPRTAIHTVARDDAGIEDLPAATTAPLAMTDRIG